MSNATYEESRYTYGTRRLKKLLDALERRGVRRVHKQKRIQPWTWAQEHEQRVRKHWRWQLLDAMWDNMNTQTLRCVPLTHYGWKAFGYDKTFKPVWTINSFLGV